MKIGLDTRVRASIRNYFSAQLLRQARHAAIDARKAEDRLEPPVFDAGHRGAVLSSVQCSVAFLEAMINELFSDAADNQGTRDDGYIAPLSSEAVARMAAVWGDTDEGRRLRTVPKYQLLLSLSGRPRLNEGSEPLQSVNLLVTLRNVIVHYRPESLFTDESHKFERTFAGKFAANPLAYPTSGWWPDKCLGSGCAEWAWRSALALTDAVSESLAIAPNYRRLIDSGWDGWGGPPA